MRQAALPVCRPAVYLVQLKNHENRYAMKVQKKSDADTELKVLKNLCVRRHPFVMRYKDHFDCSSKYGYGRECVILGLASNGEMKKHAVTASGSEMYNWFVQSLAGLSWMHHDGYVHRDIKSPNIFLDHKMRAMIGDVGLTGKLGKTTKKVKGQMGTPTHMAPEIWHDKAYTGKVDIWALGVTFFEMCSSNGRTLPFDGVSMHGLIRRIVSGIVNNLRQPAEMLVMAHRCQKGDRFNVDDLPESPSLCRLPLEHLRLHQGGCCLQGPREILPGRSAQLRQVVPRGFEKLEGRLIRMRNAEKASGRPGWRSCFQLEEKELERSGPEGDKGSTLKPSDIEKYTGIQEDEGDSFFGGSDTDWDDASPLHAQTDPDDEAAFEGLFSPEEMERISKEDDIAPVHAGPESGGHTMSQTCSEGNIKGVLTEEFMKELKAMLTEQDEEEEDDE
uniref:Protein kinase domain-containing protein n=1 Tax=Chromera velia CCMP2878 TaxID=1169474 RepID=A0A0G4F7J9_9ALVE|eukprot:Cvel_15553.t1-p1 / transcript=Cvel_15553.t1 / gene=Cvel_15553 / organism=Chromera_velia_CCMP2878 / gene_product=Serine/threonine-protein kinase Nek3, putative / transcript_product=Serine/threonine-protein kinase Nek3, putative / location=Cvel_scaffold1156:12921-16601(+) / protein_length=444 / sequence_SO=supercontig / SO=protein_coding / is_pseudo=false